MSITTDLFGPAITQPLDPPDPNKHNLSLHKQPQIPNTTNYQFPQDSLHTSASNTPSTSAPSGRNKSEQFSYAGVLTASAHKRGKIRLPHRNYELDKGKPVIVFTEEENELLANTCKWTIVGKFAKTRPSIEKIRTEFVKIVPLKGSVKIGVKDLKHVFIDVENEEDFKIIYSKNFINLDEENSMKIQKWSTKFKPEADSLAHVWINLPNLPWHYYEWAALCRIVSPIGNPIIMDKATLTKTRPTMAKLKVEIDLMKPLVHEVAVVIKNPKGEIEKFYQKIEYETIPAFCAHCKIQGHTALNCRILHPELGFDNTNEINEQDLRQGSIQVNHQNKRSNLRQRNSSHQEVTAKDYKTSENQLSKEVETNTKDKDEGWQNVDRRKNKGGHQGKSNNDKGSYNINSHAANKESINRFVQLQDNKGSEEMDTTREQACTNDSQNQNKLVNTAFKYTRVDRALEEKTKERTGKKAEKQGVRLNVRRNSNSSNAKIDETKEQLHEEIANILEVNKEELTAMVNKRKKFSKNVMIPIEMFPENKSINITSGLSKSKETIAIGWPSLNLQKGGSYQEENFPVSRNEESQHILLDPDPPEDNNCPRQDRMDMIMEDTEAEKISSKSDDEVTRQNTNGKTVLDEYTQPPEEITFRNNLSPRSITYPGGTYNLEKQPTSEQSQEQNNPPPTVSNA
ncbi:hypothetical protein KY290_011107 [Solanum tuberosum]|uniref:DUF4283 domain-containing protein n=1 Tax=Solanum tuberosum TaxID=4113 RepID=A0ABQ7W1Q1_SOLTU|nr:hypothetical protein KY290_011107 [Solanum tuberosum]